MLSTRRPGRDVLGGRLLPQERRGARTSVVVPVLPPDRLYPYPPPSDEGNCHDACEHPLLVTSYQVPMRRVALAVVLSVALLVPPSAEPQQSAKLPRVGILLYGAPQGDPNIAALLQGLADLGHVDSRTITIDHRYAAGKPERLRDLAAELVASKPDVIVSLGGDVAPITRAATTTIPIVMIVSNDPVEAGLVASMARPGGNLTGVTFVSSDLAAKRLQFVKNIAPRISRVGMLWNPDHVGPEYRETQKAAPGLGIRVQSLEVRSANDFDAAWQTAIAT